MLQFRYQTAEVYEFSVEKNFIRSVATCTKIQN